MTQLPASAHPDKQHPVFDEWGKPAGDRSTGRPIDPPNEKLEKPAKRQVGRHEVVRGPVVPKKIFSHPQPQVRGRKQ